MTEVSITTMKTRICLKKESTEYNIPKNSSLTCEKVIHYLERLDKFYKVEISPMESILNEAYIYSYDNDMKNEIVKQLVLKLSSYESELIPFITCMHFNFPHHTSDNKFSCSKLCFYEEGSGKTLMKNISRALHRENIIEKKLITQISEINSFEKIKNRVEYLIKIFKSFSKMVRTEQKKLVKFNDH